MASEDLAKREVRSFLVGRDPSIDRRFRPRPHRQVRLFNGIEEEVDSIEENSDLESDFENCDPQTSGDADTYISANDSSSTEGALVYLRLRPIPHESSAYTVNGNTFVVKASNESLSSSNNKNLMEKHYCFTDIFNRDIQQSRVYDNCLRAKIEAEESFTLLTYGTSGSGKTFTLLGSDNKPGMIPRALEQIFTMYEPKIYPHPSLKLINGRITLIEDKELLPHLELRKRFFNSCAENQEMEKTRRIICDDHSFVATVKNDLSVLIWVSFVEIYNENVYDLLEIPSTTLHSMAPPPRRNLKIVGNDGKVFIKGLTSVYVKNSVEALHLLRYGLQRVNYASTSINSNSSRSHCIFLVDVLKFFRSGSFAETSYKFCDLAGSERLDKTGNVGSRLKEAQKINKSLLVLGRCLDAANSKGKRNNDLIPFRESKLTMLLQAALLGKEKLTMIVNVMPTDKYYEENMNVLGFASIAKNIVFKQPELKTQKSRCSFFFEYSSVQVDDHDKQIQQLLEESIFLRSEVDRLTGHLEEQKRSNAIKLYVQEQELRTELAKSHEESIQQLRKQFKDGASLELENQRRAYEAKIAALTRKHEWEMEELREEYENVNERNDAKRRTLE